MEFNLDKGDEIRVDEVKRLRGENFHLKNQLKNKNKDIRNLKKSLSNLREENKNLKRNKKPKFKNGKRGTFKNG